MQQQGTLNSSVLIIISIIVHIWPQKKQGKSSNLWTIPICSSEIHQFLLVKSIHGWWFHHFPHYSIATGRGQATRYTSIGDYPLVI